MARFKKSDGKIIIFALILLWMTGISALSGKAFQEDFQDESNESVKGNESIVFIVLDTPKKRMGFHTSSISSDIKKKEIIKKLGKEKIRHEFDGMISASLTDEEIRILELDSSIEKIEPVKIWKILLQDSVPLINASHSHPLLFESLNLTGKGEAVCVIDSGINYSHSDLGRCYGNNSVSSNCKVIGGHDFVNSDSDPMDDNGHGTHVAGIVGANGTIKGVAPEVKLLALKVCDSSGSCASDNIAAAIRWCTGNATRYNISAISISLGADCNDSPEQCYSSYCNGDNLAPSINSAAANNISVVIASGNDGNTTHISLPSCIENATRVAATNKADSVTSYSNINPLVQLAAPGGVSDNSGTLINSTCISANSATEYCGRQGTSMAAPHVSGAIAIINQYLRLTNQTRTIREIESILNSSGKRVSYNVTLNFTRIKLYDALISLDQNLPNITLVSPLNDTIRLNANQTFICNSTDLSLKNATFYLWNSSSSIVNQTTRSISGGAVRFEINVSNISLGDYKWNCLFHDEQKNYSFGLTNFSFSIAYLSIELTSPGNSIFTNRNQTFTCNSTANNNLTNVTWYLWNSTGVENISSVNINGFANSTNFSFNFTHDGLYQWNCLLGDNMSSWTFASSNLSVNYDSVSPSISISSPLNGSSYNTGSFNVSLNENGSCQYSLDNGTTNLGMSAASDNRNFTALNASLVNGQSYNATFYCNDSTGNINNSNRILFTIDSSLGASSNVGSSSGSGGGGSGGGVGGGGAVSVLNTFSPKQEQLNTGFTQEVKKQDKIKFNLPEEKSQNHTLSVNDIKDGFVNITLRSDPINFLLGAGQSIKFNLSSSENYNLYVKVESIANGKANITIRTIREAIRNIKKAEEDKSEIKNQNPGITGSSISELGENDKEMIDEKFDKVYILWFFFVLLLIILGVRLIKITKPEGFCSWFCENREKSAKQTPA